MMYINSRAIALGDLFFLKNQVINGLIAPAGLYKITKIYFNSEGRKVQLQKVPGSPVYTINWDKTKILGYKPRFKIGKLYKSKLKPEIHFRIKSIGNTEVHGIVYTLDKRVEGCCLSMIDFCKHYQV